MTYRDIKELQALLDKDIRSVIAKGDITPKDYQCLDVAIDITKDLCEIAEKMPIIEEMSGNSYDSYEGDWSTEYRSGNRGRGSNNRGSSSDNELKSKLHELMHEASNEQERQVITKLMNRLEN